MEKVLLIGGNGFLGQHIVDELSGEYEIINPTKQEVNWVTRKGIADLEGLNPDVVIHLLAIYGGLPFCMSNRVRMAVENLEINANVYRYLANEMTSLPNGRIITIGSGCEYPGYQDGILKEEDLGDGKLHQSVEHYGYSKLMQLQACKALRDERGIEFEHIVLANMYGPGDIFDYYRSHVVGGVIKKFFDARENKQPVRLLGTGRAVRDLVYVKDVAHLVCLLTRLQESTNEPLNASTGVGVSIKELASVVEETMEFPYGVEWGDTSQDGCLIKYLSTERLEEVLGWKPPTTLREGIKETIEWYEKQV